MLSDLFTVFYSWQSDTKRRHGRDLIGEALELAADKIGQDPETPFRILIQSGADGEPGLCNIPETILRRLRESDAVVSDLTFVAKTSSDDPKHCSNPNVLFELGYAFSSIGPERLVCVINEAHGPAAKQIFDLAHHRRPIAFMSPKEGSTRRETVDSLAKDIEEALRGVLKLGRVGGYGGDDDILHQRHMSEIEATFRSSSPWQHSFPRISVAFRPKLFRPKRVADAESLEALVRSISPRTDRFHRFPPHQKGTAPMDWGIYNDTYGDPWALTYALQFWTEVMVGGRQAMTLSQRDAMVSPEPPNDLTIAEGMWVMADYALDEVSKAIQFARNLTNSLADSERVQLTVSARNLSGRWLAFSCSDSMGPCRAPTISREFETSAVEFREDWLAYFGQIGKDFCDLFCRDGRVVSVETVKSYQNVAGNL
jgi:hypothetical protein